jgi:hypothetical protein
VHRNGDEGKREATSTRTEQPVFGDLPLETEDGIRE